jgi:single-stranded-DNA-specific exonuclease
MKYRLIGENDYLFNLIETIGINRGVESIKKLKEASSENEITPYFLKNIEKGVNLLVHHLKNGHNIHIVPDCDVDGVTSASMIYDYIKKIKKEETNIFWSMHKGKKHGIVLDEIENFDFDLLIVPDGGSDNFKEHKLLKEKGIDVLVLDHHEVDRESEDAVVINNQLSPNYSNKNLCGAGVVYKFLKVLDDKLGINYSSEYLDLVALGTIADCMDVRNLENRYYIKKGLNNIKNDFFKALLKKQSRSIKKLTPTAISFYIAPLINSVFRIGSAEERIDLFKAFIDNKALVPYKKRGSDKEIKVFFYEDFARRCLNIKNKQNRHRDKYIKELKEQVKKYNMEYNNILIVNSTEINDKNFTGLIANSLSNSFNKPTLVLAEKEGASDVFTGSARNFNRSPIDSLKKTLIDSEALELAGGHDNAFGLTVKRNNIKKIVEYFNSLDIDLKEKIYEVDFIMKMSKINKEFILDIFSLIDLYGQNFKEPIICVKDLIITKPFFNERKTFMSFKKDNIEYIKFFPNDEDFLNFENKSAKIEAVGKVGVNEYNEEKKCQFIIEEYNLIEFIDMPEEEVDLDW